jgi:hypothetical protein
LFGRKPEKKNSSLLPFSFKIKDFFLIEREN